MEIVDRGRSATRGARAASGVAWASTSRIPRRIGAFWTGSREGPPVKSPRRMADTGDVNSKDQSLCFTCGQDVGDPPLLNRLENGLPCPTCRDRILAFLPPALPGPGSERRQVEEEAVEESAFGGLYPLRGLDDDDEPA